MYFMSIVDAIMCLWHCWREPLHLYIVGRVVNAATMPTFTQLQFVIFFAFHLWSSLSLTLLSYFFIRSPVS